MIQKSETGQSNASTPANGSTSGSATSAAGTSGASPTSSAIQSVARELKGEVKHMADDFADEAKKAAESKLGVGKDFAADQLGSVADALRKTSKELRASESIASDYVEKAASSVESMSTYFQTRTLSQLVNDVESYARREPALFLGGAFFAGLIGGRFLKAATPARTGGIGAARTGGANAPQKDRIPSISASEGARPVAPTYGSQSKPAAPYASHLQPARNGNGNNANTSSSDQARTTKPDDTTPGAGKGPGAS